MERCIKIITALLVLFTFNVNAKEAKKDAPYLPDREFFTQLREVHKFYKVVTGNDIGTQSVNINKWDPRSQVLAYCQPGQEMSFPRYITFNHRLMKRVWKQLGVNESDFYFQVILHEYSHCEFGIGHLEIPNHFMGPNGDPSLSRSDVKQQFKDLFKHLDTYVNVQKGIRQKMKLNIEHKKIPGKKGKCCICGQC